MSSNNTHNFIPKLTPPILITAISMCWVAYSCHFPTKISESVVREPKSCLVKWYEYSKLSEAANRKQGRVDIISYRLFRETGALVYILDQTYHTIAGNFP